MRLVADANVLLSAVIGGRAKVVLEHPSVTEVFAAEATLVEVQEYAGQLAARKRLALDVVLMAIASLPVTVVGREGYEKSIPDAKRRIGRRDPDDVEILALALHTGAAVGPTTTTLKTLASNGSPPPSFSVGSNRTRSNRHYSVAMDRNRKHCLAMAPREGRRSNAEKLLR